MSKWTPKKTRYDEEVTETPEMTEEMKEAKSESSEAPKKEPVIINEDYSRQMEVVAHLRKASAALERLVAEEKEKVRDSSDLFTAYTLLNSQVIPRVIDGERKLSGKR